MKVVAIDRLIGSDISPWPSADFIPDSAILPGGKPVFLPEGCAPWVVEFHAAARVDRLGKSVGERFASRYWGAWTVAARFRALGIPEQGRALSAGIDFTWVPGRWIDPVEGPIAVKVEVAGRDGEVKGSVECTPVTMADMAIDQAIATLTRLMTIKTGDQIAPCRWPFTIAAEIGDTATVSVNGDEILKLKVR